jgi:curved DNA-binding protein CbpA
MTTKAFSTHYDNLQVARTASDAVIRAAYRSLAQNYHPDRATGDLQEAERAMQIINAAYQALSNPESRREHDQWIAAMEEKNRLQAVPAQITQAPAAPAIAFSDDAGDFSPGSASDSDRDSGSDFRADLNRPGIRPEYRSSRPTPSLLSRLFCWLLVGFACASLIPLGAQIIYWFRFKVWIALPARLAFGRGGDLPGSIASFLPAKSVIPFFSDWLYHPVGLLGAHEIVYSLFDSLNVSLFYLASTILIFTVLQFFKEKIVG